MPSEPGPKRDKSLIQGALSLGIRLSGSQEKAFFTYLEELQDWNKRVNLTAIKDVPEIIEKHFLDSLGGAGIFPAGNQKVLDIGSGAGFPGLVLKIVRPELSLTLLEATGKKAAFLHHICGRLKLSKVEVVQQRLEFLKDEPGPFGFCVSRAVASPGQLLADCRRLLSPTGKVVLYEGRPSGPAASRPARTFPGWRRETHAYRLPFSGIDREIGVYSLE